jgi:hypothetical protein
VVRLVRTVHVADAFLLPPVERFRKKEKETKKKEKKRKKRKIRYNFKKKFSFKLSTNQKIK